TGLSVLFLFAEPDTGLRIDEEPNLILVLAAAQTLVDSADPGSLCKVERNNLSVCICYRLLALEARILEGECRLQIESLAFAVLIIRGNALRRTGADILNAIEIMNQDRATQ